jgi:hypothetical protein
MNSLGTPKPNCSSRLPGDVRSCDKHQIVKSPILWTLVVVALYALHQDIWFWRAARPLFAGFLPVGLTYHAVYCFASALLMWALTTYAWPSHLETADNDRDR